MGAVYSTETSEPIAGAVRLKDRRKIRWRSLPEEWSPPQKLLFWTWLKRGSEALMNAGQSYPSAGEVIDGKYQIERMLGEGGMGAVAKATHILRRAPVALKFMSPNVMTFPGAVDRFLNEGVAASQIDTDHVVKVTDVGKLPNGAPYLVMEYMQGQDLSELLQKEGQPGLDIQRSVHFTLQILRGLQVAHDAGIIHRDMKPSNCFVVEKEGEHDFVKLLDFGISKVGGSGKSASLTQTNSALGTPLYMSPEQAKSPRDVDLRSDLYSVGVILYELLTGRTPFNSESGEFTEILFKLFTQDPPPIRQYRADIPPELAAAVHKALVRDPKERYATAQEFGLALEPWSDGRSARVLNRLRTHVGGKSQSMPPTTTEGSVAGAFSKLATGQQTGTMPISSGRDFASASTDRPPPLTQDGVRLSAVPAEMGARATAADVNAATQYGPGVGATGLGPMTAQSPGMALKQTDLGAARDTSVAQPLPVAPKKTSPMPAVAAVVLVLALGGAGLGWKFSHSGAPPAAASGGTLAAPDTPPPPAPPTLPTPSVAPPIVSVSASAAPPPSASVAATPAPPKHTGGAAPPQGGSSSGGKTHLKDLKPIE
jgi:serine/threonine-protein kinase